MASLDSTTSREDQAQCVVPNVPGIEQIKPLRFGTLAMPKKKSIDISACRILPDGKYLILDCDYKESRLLLFSKDGTFLRTVATFKGSSFDVCFVRNNTVAVTLQIENKTALVDVEKNEIMETIKLCHKCCAAASDGQKMIISSMEKSTLVNLNDKSQTILEGVRAHRNSLFNGNIYGTIYHEDKVYCYKSTGEVLWTFEHYGIDNPQGITVDMYGFVYFVSQENNKVFVISPDGQTSRIILSKDDGIKYPYEIHINRGTGIMVVSSEVKDDSDSKSYETALVYKI
ncbi:unnamed protein product [Mytilus coruscus]|uniref:Uncharacterized protein n=1 Tax=Mytilus coruscus TaxID=42192 RepID=A0A6J8BJT7_MYTCO|nr:unnamed protein product [Mytilus coruscus]